jgi:hypothetical protein
MEAWRLKLEHWRAHRLVVAGPISWSLKRSWIRIRIAFKVKSWIPSGSGSAKKQKAGSATLLPGVGQEQEGRQAARQQGAARLPPPGKDRRLVLPATQINADPCGSGSETLREILACTN